MSGREFSAFSSFRGRTLGAVNHAIPDRISDHNPITVDLPLAEPGHTVAAVGQ
jgi:hypothetical protein